MDFDAAIRRESDVFHRTASTADPDRPIGSCPGWVVADLVWHLGQVHWFWATDVATRALDVAEVERAMPDRPSDFAELLRWSRAQSNFLIDQLATTPDDVRVWTWALNDGDRSVRFVRRHQVQETAVHRWDLQAAVAPPPGPIEAGAASDGIDEVLAVTLPWTVRADKPLPGSVHLHCADVEGEWLVHADGRVDRAHAKGAVAIRGPASDILLALYGRVPVVDLDLVGDTPVAQEFVARINTE